ncbi:MAG: hypothetical protein WC979_02115 [Candidatus Pacearchaeota archaeon]|jgi:hypothetical protein|nr:hypothetical protein [Clostridia bacterium]
MEKDKFAIIREYFYDTVINNDDMPTMEDVIIILQTISKINKDFKWSIDSKGIHIGKKNIKYKESLEFCEIDYDIDVLKDCILEIVGEMQSVEDAAVEFIYGQLQNSFITNCVESTVTEGGIIYFRKRNFETLYNKPNGIKYEIDKVKEKNINQYNEIFNKDAKPDKHGFTNDLIELNCVNEAFTINYILPKRVWDHIDTYVKETIIPDHFDDSDNVTVKDIAYYWGI